MIPGPELFGRYAFPPNVLGYCGPADSGLTEGLSVGDAAAELHHVVRQFDGAWPYLELIGGLTGRDPMDRQVVEAYWVGNELLEHTDTLTWGNSLDGRFRARAGGRWDHVESGIIDGVPNHAFHVFCVYPWVGLLRSGHAGHALTIIDRCRIRWGVVESSTGHEVIVRYAPLTWDGEILAFGDPVVETVSSSFGTGLLRVGAVVSLHWDYVCEELDRRKLGYLRAMTMRHLAIANRSHGNLAPAIEG